MKAVDRASRRHFLQASAGLTMAGMAGGWPSLAAAQAQCGPITVATWGGDYGNVLQKYTAGAAGSVVFDVGDQNTRRTKMRAAGRSHLDVAILNDIDMFEMSKAGVLEPIDAAHVSNLANVYPDFLRPYAVAQSYSASVIVYNTNYVKTPPKSLMDLLEPSYKGKVGLSDISFLYHFLGGALAEGNVNDVERGIKYLQALKANSPRVLPSNEAIASALSTGEIHATLIWKARAFQWQKSGLPLAFAFPEEGAVPITYEVGLLAKSTSKPCGFQYLNTVLEKDTQQGFAEVLGFAPTLRTLGAETPLVQAIDFTAAERAKLAHVDFDYVIENRARIFEYWNQSFKPGLV